MVWLCCTARRYALPLSINVKRNLFLESLMIIPFQKECEETITSLACMAPTNSLFSSYNRFCIPGSMLHKCLFHPSQIVLLKMHVSKQVWKAILLTDGNGWGKGSWLLHTTASAFSWWLPSFCPENVPPEAGLLHGQWWRSPNVLSLGSVNAWLVYLIYYWPVFHTASALVMMSLLQCCCISMRM